MTEEKLTQDEIRRMNAVTRKKIEELIKKHERRYPHGMPEEEPEAIEMILKSTPESFSAWLENEIKEAEGLEFSSSRGPIILDGSIRKIKWPPSRVDIEAVAWLIHIWPDLKDEPIDLIEKIDCGLKFPAYHFIVIGLDDNEHVHIKLIYPKEMQSHIDNLFKRIKQMWPEALTVQKQEVGATKTVKGQVKQLTNQEGDESQTLFFEKRAKFGISFIKVIVLF